MSEELRPALSHKDSLLRINELIEERDYWKRRYEAARDVAIEFARKIYYAEPSQGQIVVDEEIERRIKENK